MDITTPLIFVGIFVIASLSLFFVYKFGIKEKSYEEALAEQRQQTNALLGVKPKPKEKKNKKAVKKTKEKQPNNVENSSTEKSDNAELENTDSSQPQPQKLHVEFKDTPEVIVKESPTKKHLKQEKVKSILLNKEKDRRVSNVGEVPLANHFEESHPKDDLELLMSTNDKEELVLKQEPVKEKIVVEKKQKVEAEPPQKPSKKAAKTSAVAVETPVQPVQKEKEEKIVEPVIVQQQTNGLVANAGKEKKKKKSEYNTLQQITAERDGLLNLVRKAELSRSEVQILIDLLLNKQHEAPAIVDDWSEGKSDPVQKLKKQLADKEKIVLELKEALTGAQNKLREIRSEQQTERRKLEQKIRETEDLIQVKIQESQAANNRAHAQTLQLQQLQAQLNEEVTKFHNAQEDYKVLHMQFQQADASGQQMLMEITRLKEEISAEKQKHQTFNNELNDTTMRIEQLMDMNRQLANEKNEIERKLEVHLRQENEYITEVSHLKSAYQQQLEEQRRIEHGLDQSQEEFRQVEKQRNEAMATLAQLKLELQKLNEEKSQLQVKQVNGSSEENKAHKVELLNLTNELSSVTSELQQTKKNHQAELLTSTTKYSLLQKELEEQKSKNNKLTNEIRTKEKDSQKQFIQRLFPEIEELKSVNTEDWQEECGRLIKKYVNNLQKQHQQQKKTASPEKLQDVEKLQAQLQHYKNIIDDTEGMLNKLQMHIEQEEINWRSQLAAKDAEVEELKEQHNLQLQKRVSSLEQELSLEQQEKHRLTQECQLLKSRSSNADATATVEKLTEEVNRLTKQLRMVQSKNGDLNSCPKGQNNCNSTNGPSLIEGN